MKKKMFIWSILAIVIFVLFSNGLIEIIADADKYLGLKALFIVAAACVAVMILAPFEEKHLLITVSASAVSVTLILTILGSLLWIIPLVIFLIIGVSALRIAYIKKTHDGIILSLSAVFLIISQPLLYYLLG